MWLRLFVGLSPQYSPLYIIQLSPDLEVNVWLVSTIMAFIVWSLCSFRDGGKTRKSWVSLSPPHAHPPYSGLVQEVRKLDAQTFRSSSSSCASAHRLLLVRWKTKGREKALPLTSLPSDTVKASPFPPQFAPHSTGKCGTMEIMIAWKHTLNLDSVSLLDQFWRARALEKRERRWGMVTQCAFHHRSKKRPTASHLQVYIPGAILAKPRAA